MPRLSLISVSLIAMSLLNCAVANPTPDPIPVETVRDGSPATDSPPPETRSPVCDSKIQLTEMMIDPAATPDATSEYLELHNPGSDPIPLAGWILRDGRHRPEVLHTDHVIAAGGFAILAPSDDMDANGDLAVDVVIHRFTLPNRGGLVHIQTPCGESAIRVRYSARPPWPSLRPGVALELRTPLRNPAAPRSWRGARRVLPSGDYGSPGRLR
jgi:hypothetical protein